MEEIKKRSIQKLNHRQLVSFIEGVCIVSDLTAKRYIDMIERHGLLIKNGGEYTLPKTEGEKSG